MKKTNDVQPGPGSASERSESLLDLIAREAHCDYLSDLHSLYLKGQLPDEISQITKDSFGVQQWNDCLLYTSGFEAETGSFVGCVYRSLSFLPADLLVLVSYLRRKYCWLLEPNGSSFLRRFSMLRGVGRDRASVRYVLPGVLYPGGRLDFHNRK